MSEMKLQLDEVKTLAKVKELLLESATPYDRAAALISDLLEQKDVKPKDTIEIGEIVLAWDKDEGMSTLEIYEGKNRDVIKSFIVDGPPVHSIKRPHGIPNIRIKWNGGECPVGEDDVVIVELRDGAIYRCVARDSLWRNGGGMSDIAFYTLIKKA